MKRFLLLVPLLVMFARPGLAGGTCRCRDAAEHAQRQEQFDRVLRAHDTMGASIALISDGQIVDMFQYGRANRADNIPVEFDTYFKVASVSKMITAVGVMRMVEEEGIDPDADFGDYFEYSIRNPYHPDVPITLRQIMTHTATLNDGYHYHRAMGGNIELLRHVLDGNFTRQNYYNRMPGEWVRYSNFGGGLLGAFIEQVTGYTVDEYMQMRVFFPLGVYGGYHTPCLPHDAKIARVYNTDSTGMTFDAESMDGEHMDADPDTAYVHTAGSAIVNAEGLAKILIALAGDGSVDGVRILSEESVRAMRERQNNIGSVRIDSGRGLNLNIIENQLVKGRTLYGHQGKAYGMICAAYFDPADRTGVVLLTNGCNTATVDSVARIARAVIAQAYAYLP